MIITRTADLEYSGCAVIGQPGIGEWPLHHVSPEHCLMANVGVSVVCVPSLPMRKAAHHVSMRFGRQMDFQRWQGPEAQCILGE